MDFAFTEEQEALREGVRTVLSAECTPDALRAFERINDVTRNSCGKSHDKISFQMKS